ncbi:hypothetical protein ACFX13_029830 [Malus domestica]|uniref:transcription factor SCREAM2-like isoform X1 n=1 Tax=Malus domestica TaxID=3750 RepID=UPI000498ACC2|nr:transcription factor SCREAM2-like isoform X1 [Malus domestica]XP_050138211.1 transcription factor SCREAM2-like isoform X1 [Malus sylvestris]
MVSKVQMKRAPVSKKLLTLRSISKSHAHSKTAIVFDASKYIQNLKRKVEEMNLQTIASAQTSTSHNPFSVQLKVEAREEGFLIKMFSEKSCSGLLVFVLEAFEELGLDVHQARVSCSNNFLLEAVGTINDNQSAEQKDVEVVKEAMLQAIQNWSEVSQQQE